MDILFKLKKVIGYCMHFASSSEFCSVVVSCGCRFCCPTNSVKAAKALVLSYGKMR